MGKRPFALCKLQKGKLLSAFPGFVDTWNWIVDFCNNLRGDSTEKASGLRVCFDKTNTEFPVIRLEGEPETALSFQGTSGSAIQVGDGSNPKSITFASASDSNVVVACAGTGSTSGGHYSGVLITVGVYYK